MAYLTTLEGDDTATAPISINDLFAVNDFYGLKLFGDAWPDVKKAAAIIAQRAANSPIMFYIRSQANNNATPGKSSAMGRKLWGYNDRAGVELLGAPCWNAVKSEFDELLGWNPFSTLKKVGSTLMYPVTWTANKLEQSNIPIVKQLGTSVKFITSMGTEFTPITTGERLTNLAQAKGYVTQDEIDEAYRIEKEQQRQQALKDSAARASQAAAEAAKAKQEYENKLQALEQVAAATGMDTAAAAVEATQQAAADNTKTIILVGAGLGALYLLTREKR
jgi:hypothetical protein